MKLNQPGNVPLYLPRDPISPMEAATKSYVDTGLSAHASSTALHLTSDQNSWLDAIVASAIEVNYLQGVSSNVQDQLEARLPLGGGTLTGALVLHADPVASDQAANKAYVDTRVATAVADSGDTMTGPLVLHADPVAPTQASTKRYVDNAVSTHAASAELHVTPEQNSFLDAITVTATEVNRLEGLTDNAQSQLNARLPLSGGEMTGDLTLSGNPTLPAHAANKTYVDSGLALKLNLSGGVLTGQVRTELDPADQNDLARKAYVDATVNTHASSAELHLTSAQNTLLDELTVGSAEINQLQGIAGNVQELLNAKFDKSGGEISGDVSLAAGKAVFVSKLPVAGNELVNKAYVDARAMGQKWEDPITASNLIDDTLSVPPLTPSNGDTYIVGNMATGDWQGLDGFAVTFNGETWTFLQTRPVEPGDRFGVAITTTATGTRFIDNAMRIMTLIGGGPGEYQWEVEDAVAGSTTLVFDPNSLDFGITYTFTDEGNWVPTNSSVNLAMGDGLEIVGNTVSVNPGAGIGIVDDAVTLKVAGNGVLAFDENSAVYVKLKSSHLQATGTGIALSPAVEQILSDAITVSGGTMTGDLIFAAGYHLRITSAPVVGTDAVNQQYVASVRSEVREWYDVLRGEVDVLSTDPTTRDYVNTVAAYKVNKTGDTMTGHLTLSGDPTSNLHAASKSYVDASTLTHAQNEQLHVSADQRTLLNELTVASSELNQLGNITSNVQAQLDSTVKKAGDAMTGELLLFGEPVNPMGAVPRSMLVAAAALKLNLTGGSLTGYLGLHDNPSADMHAATKLYVDGSIQGHSSSSSLHLSEAQNAWLDAISATATEINYLQGVASSVQDQINTKLTTSGGTMSGPISLSGIPTADAHAANKQYVDSGLALKLNLTGGILTGPVSLPAGDPSAEVHAAHKGYVDAQIADATTDANNRIDLKVAKAGDTMAGYLTLHAAPSADMHASTKKYTDDSFTALSNSVTAGFSTIAETTTALRGDVDGLLVDPVTKSYVDTRDGLSVAKSGDTMTGYLTLHADPLLPMHPATMRYVDAVAQGLKTKPSVRFATTANLNATYNNGTFGVNATLTGSVNGALVVDGRNPGIGDRILVRLQTTGSHNGDYVVQQTGDVSSAYILKRVTTVDESSEVPGSYYYVFDGDTLKGTGWVFTVANPITFAIGTDPISVNQFSGQGSLIAGDGVTIDGNTIHIGTANPTRIVINANDIDLAVTGVTPGSYTKMVVDGYGRVISGSNPNTLVGYGIVDAQPLNSNLTSLSAVVTTGLLVRTNSNTVETRKLAVSGIGLTINNDGSGVADSELTITTNATPLSTPNSVVARDESGNFAANAITANLTGNASTATTLKTTRNIRIAGAVVAANVGFNGSADITLEATLSDSGVVPGTYSKVTVGADGRLTMGENPTTLEGYGIVDAATLTYVNSEIADLRSQLQELHAYVMSRI